MYSFSVTLIMFRTELNFPPSTEKIGLKDTIVSLGSCFADNHGERLILNKLSCLVNPAGIIYNPYSICKVIDYALNEELPDQASYLQKDGVFLNFDFHSRISDTDGIKLQQKISHSLHQLQKNLVRAKWLIITFGTAVVYTRKDNKIIVANCHKVPASKFNKGMLSQKQILAVFMHTYQSIMAANPEIQILLTVSPVRHVRDTLEINSISKAILRITSDTLKTELPNIHYFPSYEIMMDDLRDYRFYADDLIHPSHQAMNYIWEKFCKGFMDDALLDFINKWGEIRKDLNHRPFHPETKSHLQFLTNTLEKLKQLSGEVNLEVEIAQLEKQLNDK